jgi:hypothetical protein
VSSRNHALTYRPVQGGTLIINPTNDRPGTLGAVLSGAGADRFALSCYHVLGRADGSRFAEGESVLQSLTAKGGSQIGQLFVANCAPALDVAAAKIDSGMASVGRVLGLGPLGKPSPPAAGMRVLKAGAFTGVTEGEVVRVQGDRIDIRRPAGYPPGYELCDFGDSGAVWVEQDSGSPVALHTGQAPNGDAVALRFEAVLAALHLTLLRE